MKYLIAAVLLAIASVVIPDLRTAMQRSDQKRTMADMRTIATAWEARAEDRNTYLVGRPGVVSYQNLRRVLEPTYTKHLPSDDGWNNPFIFTSSDQDYSMRAIVADHQLDAHLVLGATTDFDCDIVYTNGTFIASPVGLRKQL